MHGRSSGALADGVPKRDLRLTHGHSLYLDGMLIPVDLLINGHTILWDDAARSVEFYHVELAGHDVLIADGAPAESYREDGNRGLFENLDPPRVTTADAPWFAPVTTAGPERHLLERSGWVEPPVTHDPDLHLLADGVRIDAIAVEGRRHRFQGAYRFRLEQRPAELSIVSRNTVPRELGINHDRRRLGVALRSIALRGAGAEIDLEYDSAALDDGFHAPEHAARHRWTTGRAALPNACYGSFGGPFEVLIEVVCAAKYPLLGEYHAAELATAA